MKHQLKIVMDYEISDADHSVTSTNILVVSDDEPVGCIQDLKLHATANNPLPELEVTFPNLHDPKIDPVYKLGESNLIASVDHHFQLLLKVPNIRLILKDLDPESAVQPLGEIGTDGFIELVPMKKRHEP